MDHNRIEMHIFLRVGWKKMEMNFIAKVYFM